ncbi:MAG: carbon starvation protein A [Candidatus Omnitrophica bacterium CG11_big_fil_rev_8_21_14_0_20_45_26]|uniref:Carbon starvation protein A n=1 Tax=Candidatus Abzuiibacterium crystallinum TaxID=1974748 RepID=A0A2H0LL61_9BACT|nr:MAG: carbon starvation protein A [Candidatus Omnitrophica bacterium CG11_big_fil_rev_8_21_14_0_20_45_26]PIW63794.1 MAG: carbon starvation protein A [Candidatus Omnitrophica bacterium CG12_big_fil_rev_8_21_14_0_65_45_16]
MPINSLVVLIGVLIALTLAYRLYGRFLARHFGADFNRRTPAHTQYDGVDFVPAKNWMVLFGHHFSSICGAGPIIGPVLACAYWGWGPSLLWLLIGAIWMGAVSDFASLFVSVRSQGSSIAEIAKPEISARARLFFSIFIWISIILVIAVFAIFAAKTLTAEPSTVVPSVGLIPTAMLIGWLFYAKNVGMKSGTAIGLSLLALLLWTGNQIPLQLPGLFGLDALTLWIILLLFYCFIASVLPVQYLLQPRDYLASYVLFGSIAIGIIGIVIVRPEMQPEIFRAYQPLDWPQAGPLWPMLFVTIACGAISGFHSLVSSGTTCKQLDSERHACRIGYGGMLLECLVGVLVLICVSAAMSGSQLAQVLKEGGPIAAYSEGYGSLTRLLLSGYGKPFAVLALNAFLLTTLDSATRIARYLTSELFGIKNMYTATALVVIAAGALALTGKWNLLWPAFGAANQLIAGLSLLVVSCWLLKRGKAVWHTLIPAGIMLITTLAALAYQCRQTMHASPPNYFIAAVAAMLIVVAVIVFLEALNTLRKRKRGQRSF